MPPKQAVNSTPSPTAKIPLNAYLKLFNDAGMPMKHAIAMTGKLYKIANTYESISRLDAAQLTNLGFDAERRKEIMEVVKKCKMIAAGTTDKQEKVLDIAHRREQALDAFTESITKSSSSPSKKRKRGTASDDDLLPKEEAAVARLGNFDFKEVTDEEKLKTRKVTINRAPVMMAWSFVVAEKLGFERQEALSIASVYTEMNATTKGVNLGIYEKGKEKGMEPSGTTAQPHVELMGRRPLLQTENEQWRGLVKGQPVSPAKAFQYITNSLAQMSPFLLGALYLLANSYSDPQELNREAYRLYCDFRPEVTGWGAKGHVDLGSILNLRKKSANADEPEHKKRKIDLSVEGVDEDVAGDDEFTLWDLFEGQE